MQYGKLSHQLCLGAVGGAVGGVVGAAIDSPNFEIEIYNYFNNINAHDYNSTGLYVGPPWVRPGGAAAGGEHRSADLLA